MNYTKFHHEYRSSRISENLWRKLLQIAEFNNEKNSRDAETEKILGSRYKDDHSFTKFQIFPADVNKLLFLVLFQIS